MKLVSFKSHVFYFMHLKVFLSESIDFIKLLKRSVAQVRFRVSYSLGYGRPYRAGVWGQL